MSKSVKVHVLKVEILQGVRPYGIPPRKPSSVQGHEFDFEVELQFVPVYKVGFGAMLDFDENMLKWAERIRWYAPDPYQTSGNPHSNTVNWKMLREDVVDFASSKRRFDTATVRRGWFGSQNQQYDSTYPGWQSPWELRMWRDVPEALLPGKNPVANFAQLEIKDQKLAIAQHFKDQKQTLKTVMTDRPALTKDPGVDDGSWTQSGGGGMWTLERRTRRRVVHFKLSAGSNCATATQILESVNGVPTIQKFILPGITVQEAEDPTLLARYRTEYDSKNANNFNLHK